MTSWTRRLPHALLPACALGLCLARPAVAAPDSARVAVVCNDNSPISRAITAAYVKARRVNAVVRITCPDSATGAETIAYPAFKSSIEDPLRAFLAARKGIDFVVLTKGVPIRVTDAPGIGMFNKQPSVDSLLAALDYDQPKQAVKVTVNDSGFSGTAYSNRFWNSKDRFSHARFGGYLVTRLDGYTEADALALIERAIASEKAKPTGTVLLDACPPFGFSNDPQPVQGFPTPAPGQAAVSLGELNFNHYNADMRNAAGLLKELGVPAELDTQDAFAGPRTGLGGYCSWGSNDAHYNPVAYHGLAFAPGAVAETAVSTSARTFLPTTGGQSLIADLVAQGVTGVKGYTDEPLLQAVASPTILFPRYASGWTLAESFYAASRFVGWEDVVIGDPICRPYRR